MHFNRQRVDCIQYIFPVLQRRIFVSGRGFRCGSVSALRNPRPLQTFHVSEIATERVVEKTSSCGVSNTMKTLIPRHSLSSRMRGSGLFASIVAIAICGAFATQTVQASPPQTSHGSAAQMVASAPSTTLVANDRLVASEPPVLVDSDQFGSITQIASIIASPQRQNSAVTTIGHALLTATGSDCVAQATIGIDQSFTTAKEVVGHDHESVGQILAS
ncbi:MAG: hypothetical protein JWO73_309 [Candidatus Taylorbacteria bacterium]|nr:hypothetical protein [Candidatus Taylorbacteria bacterium]